MKSSSKLIVIMMFSLMILSMVPPSFGNVNEGFDNYIQGYAGNTLPIPWTFTTNNSNCWSVPTNAPPTGVTPLGNTYQPTAEATTSPPNAFEFNFNANCYGFSTQASITTTINMTSSTLFLSWWQSMIAVQPPASNPATVNHLPANTVVLSLLVDGVVVYSNDTSSIIVDGATGCPVGCWNQVSNSAGLPETIGSVHTVTWQVSVVPYSDAYTFSFAIDTLGFVNSNPIITGNNFVMMNYATHEWFNFGSVNGSQLSLNYTAPDNPPPCKSGGSAFVLGPGANPPPTVVGAGNNCIVSNLSMPDIIVPDISLVSLATVTVGNSSVSSYSRSVIPCLDPLNGVVTVDPLTCLKQRMYFDTSTTLNPITKYAISITDLTSTVSNSSSAFGSVGVRMFIYRGTTLITSGYTDAQATFNTALVQATYRVILLNAAGDEYSTSINAGTNPAISIQISIAGFAGGNNALVFSIAATLTCNGTDVVATYYDTQAETTQVTFNLSLYNISGISPPISTQTVSMAGVSASVTFPINQTLASEYLVYANSTRANGISPATYPTLGPVAAGVQSFIGCSINLSFPHTPPFPNSVLGLNEILPTPAAWLNLLSLFILFITAALFGARAASLGTIFVVIEAIVFAEAGWMPFQSFYVSAFMVVSIVVFLAQKSRKRY